MSEAMSPKKPQVPLKWVGEGDYPDVDLEDVTPVALFCSVIKTQAAWITVEEFNDKRNEEVLDLTRKEAVHFPKTGWDCPVCGRQHPYDIMLARPLDTESVENDQIPIETIKKDSTLDD